MANQGVCSALTCSFRRLEKAIMNRFVVLLTLVALLFVPAVAAAQYDDYPMGGGGNGGGGQSGGGGYPSGGGMPSVGSQSDDASDGGSESDVAIIDFAFQPAAVFVHAGDTVSWSNNGQADHTVTDNAGAFDSGVLSPGGEYSETFDTPGVYSYHCEIHDNMRGTLVVTGA
jgi:plastocyanin